MFRALLWKEWRELWVLPVAAAPLGVIGFFMSQVGAGPHTRTAWDLSFGLWLVSGAIFIPAHLYGRETRTDEASFLLARPIDRFRLWWLKLTAGATILLPIGLILYAATLLLRRLYPDTATFELEELGIILSYSRIAALFFCYTCLLSSIFERLITAIVGGILIIASVVWTVFLMIFFLRIPFGHSIVNTILSIDPAILCPPLLLASLVAFTHKDRWRKTRRSLLIGYGVPGAIALLAMVAIDPSFFSALIRGVSPSRLAEVKTNLVRFFTVLAPQPQVRQESHLIRIHDISSDRKQMVVEVFPQFDFVVVNIDDRHAEIAREGFWRSRAASTNESEILIADESHYGFNPHTVVWSIEEDRKRRIVKIRHPDPDEGRTLAWSGSHGGNYLAVTEGNDPSLKGKTKEAIISFYDSDGERVGEYGFSALGKTAIDPIGWDSESRLYIHTKENKGGGADESSWRIRPGETTLQSVPYLDRYKCSESSVSPNGKWIVCRISGKWRGWVVRRLDVAEGPELGLPVDVYECYWSHDGKLLSFIERGDASSGDILIIIEPATEEIVSIPLEELPRWLDIWKWSPSDKYLLLYSQSQKDVLVFSVESRTFRNIPPPDEPLYAIYWLSDDRLIHLSENKIFAREIDKAEWKEVFRIEDKKFFFDGEEQS
jgi:ABC-type transport system involved in multi-copper enzyme maturation permease subunit